MTNEELLALLFLYFKMTCFTKNKASMSTGKGEGGMIMLLY